MGQNASEKNSNFKKSLKNSNIVVLIFIYLELASL